MKAVLDTMLWVSYCTRRHGSRHRLIDRALKAKVRLFVSDYILGELAEVLVEDLKESARYAHLARRAVLRRAKLVPLPKNIRALVPGDPDDDAVVQTARTCATSTNQRATNILLGFMASARGCQLPRELATTVDRIDMKAPGLIRTQASCHVEVALCCRERSDELQRPVQNGSVDAVTSANHLR